MRKRPMKMNEDQYQLGIRKLSPHEMVTMIVGYRNDVLRGIQLIRQILASPTITINEIQRSWLNESIKAMEERATDYELVLED